MKNPGGFSLWSKTFQKSFKVLLKYHFIMSPKNQHFRYCRRTWSCSYMKVSHVPKGYLVQFNVLCHLCWLLGVPSLGATNRYHENQTGSEGGQRRTTYLLSPAEISTASSHHERQRANLGAMALDRKQTWAKSDLLSSALRGTSSPLLWLCCSWWEPQPLTDPQFQCCPVAKAGLGGCSWWPHRAASSFL